MLVGGSEKINLKKRAVVWLVLMPVGVILSQLIGLAIATGFGLQEGQKFNGAVWQLLLILIPTTIVICAPGLMAAKYGKAAVDEGDKGGRIFFYLGIGFSIFFLLIAILTSFGIGQS